MSLLTRKLCKQAETPQVNPAAGTTGDPVKAARALAEPPGL